MNEMQELYQEIILDHNKRPRNFHKIDGFTHHAEGNNPLCGDEIEVFVKVKDGIIEDISFQGEGCAICKASGSLMTSTLKGRSVEDAHKEFGVVIEILTGRNAEPADLAEVGDLAALQGVRQFPARIKCATLSWHTMEAALKGKEGISTE